MKMYLISTLCCILLFVSCSSRVQVGKGRESAATEPFGQHRQEGAPSKADEAQVPPASSFCTIILAEGERILPQDRHALAGKEREEFQNALRPSQWQEPVDYQPKGEFLNPCVMAEAEDGSIMYISPANRDAVFDNTVIFMKYGEILQYSAVYYAPGEVAQEVEALRVKWKAAADAAD